MPKRRLSCFKSGTQRYLGGGTIQGSVVEAQSSERHQWATVEGALWQ